MDFYNTLPTSESFQLFVTTYARSLCLSSQLAICYTALARPAASRIDLHATSACYNKDTRLKLMVMVYWTEDHSLCQCVHCFEDDSFFDPDQFKVILIRSGSSE